MTSGEGKSVRILLVDDDLDMRVLIAALVEQRWKGVLLDLAADGTEAVEKVNGGGYDVVLTDVQMPDMDGYETAAAIRKLPPPHCHIKIVCMTGGTISEERLRENNIDGHLLKPFTLDDLRLKVSEVVSRPLWSKDDE